MSLAFFKPLLSFFKEKMINIAKSSFSEILRKPLRKLLGFSQKLHILTFSLNVQLREQYDLFRDRVHQFLRCCSSISKKRWGTISISTRHNLT